MWQMIPRLLHVQLSGLSVLDFLWALQSIRFNNMELRGQANDGAIDALEVKPIGSFAKI